MHAPRVRIPELAARKVRGEKIAVLTAYDATLARLLERAGVDALLVGDSVGMAALGYETTLPVTLDVMVHHTAAVSRGAHRALVVADMPFLTYQISPSETVRNAGRLLQEGGAAAVKVEGAGGVVETVRRLVDVGIPVMGHLGVLPQSVHQMGGYRQRATQPADAEALLADAQALQQAGAFAVVLESIPSELARTVTATLTIPTIGIGAGPHCDGQILVSYDMLGLFEEFVPPFVKPYANLAATVIAATQTYLDDVRNGRFPLADTKPVTLATRSDVTAR
jgi:3-methyl-2-oxobutanoate hydroxymethyltransferase